VYKGERGKEHRQRASHPNQNQRSRECLQTSPNKREAFVQKKAMQFDEEVLIKMSDIGVFRTHVKFYKRLNDVRRPFEPQVAMYRANKNQLLARWKEQIEEHLNEETTNTSSRFEK
jgi:hypothetical protein